MHLFVVNSGVTLQACRRVVAHLGLDTKEVVVMAGRGFGERLADAFGEVWDMGREAFPDVPMAAPVHKQWAALGRFDGHLERLLRGRTYTLYIPHTISANYQLLATHKACTAFQYIEEGLLTYRDPDEVRSSLRTQVPPMDAVRRSLLKGRWRLDWPYDGGAGTAYGFSLHSFAHTALNKVVLDPAWPLLPPMGLPPKEGLVCVLAPAHSTAKVRWSPEQYYRLLAELARGLWELQRPVFLRFHPDQRKDERALVRALFRNGTTPVQEIDDDVQMESLCATVPVTVLNGGSSVGIYAQAMGLPVYSYLPLLKPIAPAVAEHWERIHASLSIGLRERSVLDLVNAPAV